MHLCPSPVVVAPMAGGPSTPALVVAAAEAGALAFLAGGYLSGEALAERVGKVRASTSRPFGVNLFVPGRPTADEHGLAAYLEELRPDADALGVDLGRAIWDDDDWEAKLGVCLDDPPAVVSFTFGCPPRAVVEALRGRGVFVVCTVTTTDEALQAEAVGPDAICVQGKEAGAHQASFAQRDRPPSLSTLELLAAVRQRTALPVISAGGLTRPRDVLAAIRQGAAAVQCGTAFLACPESGAHPLHQAALSGNASQSTAMTRSFSGRWARALVNPFMKAHPSAPDAYPEIHNATRPLRTAAATQGRPEFMSLWAGTGFRDVVAEPAASVLDRLAGAV